jgi:hypothetical protein
VFDLVAARTVLREDEAVAAGYIPLTSQSSLDDHKAYYPGAQPRVSEVALASLTKQASIDPTRPRPRSPMTSWAKPTSLHVFPRSLGNDRAKVSPGRPGKVQARSPSTGFWGSPLRFAEPHV